MKRFITGLAICVMAVSFYGQNTWVQRDSVGGPPKSACVSFSMNGFGFIGLGFDQFEYKRSLYLYNPNFDDWVKTTSMGGATGQGLERSSAVAFVAKYKAYIGTGQGGNAYLRDFWEYNSASDTWTQVADFAGSSRREAAAFGISDFGYVGTGIDSAGTLKKDFWKYDPTLNTWSSVSDFGGTARKQAVSFAMGGQGYLGTGDDGSFTNDFWQYEPLTDTWEQKASFAGTPRHGSTGFGIFPNAYLGTGYDNTLNYTNDFWEYNYFNDTWVQVADFIGTPRANATSFALGDRGFLGTGYDGQTLDDFYEYTPLLSVESQFQTVSKVYPNPVKNELNIHLNNSIEVDELTLYSLSGKIIFQETITASNNRISTNVTTLASGMYLYSAKIKGRVVAHGKFMVSK
jgi:hypothetical protein